MAVQARQLAGRGGQITQLRSRATVSDSAIADLTTRANTRITALATDNTQLRVTTQRLTKRVEQLEGRTWAGKIWRKMYPVLSPVGLITLAGITLKIFL